MRKIIGVFTMVLLILLVTVFVPAKIISTGTSTYQGKLVEVETESRNAFVPLNKLGSELTKVEGLLYKRVNYVHDFQMHFMIFLTLTFSYYILINIDLKKKSNRIKID